MTGVPVKFRKGGEASASYDWVDLTTGLGYKTFYACGGYQAGARTYFLTQRVIDSATSYQYIGAGDNVVVTLTFDITISKPMTLASGTAFFNATSWISAAGGSSIQITPTIYHVSVGAVETSLGSAAAPGRGTLNSYFREALAIALTGKTFGVGEKLRMKVVITPSAGGGTGGAVYFDPASLQTFADASGRTIGSDMTLDIPFKIDI